MKKYEHTLFFNQLTSMEHLVRRSNNRGTKVIYQHNLQESEKQVPRQGLDNNIKLNLKQLNINTTINLLFGHHR